MIKNPTQLNSHQHMCHTGDAHVLKIKIIGSNIFTIFIISLKRFTNNKNKNIKGIALEYIKVQNNLISKVIQMSCTYKKVIHGI